MHKNMKKTKKLEIKKQRLYGIYGREKKDPIKIYIHKNDDTNNKTPPLNLFCNL